MTRRWVLACALAETVGMTAASLAARAADSRGVAASFALILAGGVVEGCALGLLQARVLAPRLGAAGARRWALLTVLVAGVGWSGGALPSALSGDDGGATPPLGLVVAGAVAMGAVLGTLLGAAQATVLTHHVAHPHRWLTANAVGWAVAMPLIFVGATTAGAGWPRPALAAFGALTGAVAGTALGGLTGLWLPALDGLPVRHRATLAWLTRWPRPASSGWTALSVTGRTSGHQYRFPVMSAPLGRSSLVVLPGHPDRKTWWRNLPSEPDARVEVLDDGLWVPAHAQLRQHGSLAWSVARSAYVARWPRIEVGAGPLIVVDLRTVPSAKDQSPADVGPGAMGAFRP